MLLKYGLRVSEGRAYCGDIELSDSALGRASGVDRRIVKATIETIEAKEDLLNFFTQLEPTALFVEVAPGMGWSAIEVIPTNARNPGILADVASVISQAGISIRQALVDDPELCEMPRLHVVTESPVPPEMIPLLQRCRGVKSIILH